MCKMTASKRIPVLHGLLPLAHGLALGFFCLREQKLRLRLYFVQPQSEVVHRKRRQKQVYEQLAADQPEKAQSAASRKYFFPRRGMRLYTTRQNGRNTTRNAVEKKEVRALPFPARNNEESSISVSLLQAHAPACCSFYVPHDLAQSIPGRSFAGNEAVLPSLPEKRIRPARTGRALSAAAGMPFVSDFRLPIFLRLSFALFS